MDQKIKLSAAHYPTQRLRVKTIWLLSFGFCVGFWALFGYLLWEVCR